MFFEKVKLAMMMMMMILTIFISISLMMDYIHIQARSVHFIRIVEEHVLKVMFVEIFFVHLSTSSSFSSSQSNRSGLCSSKASQRSTNVVDDQRNHRLSLLLFSSLSCHLFTSQSKCFSSSSASTKVLSQHTASER